MPGGSEGKPVMSRDIKIKCGAKDFAMRIMSLLANELKIGTVKDQLYAKKLTRQHLLHR